MFIGIDAGGSKTAGILVDRTGVVRAGLTTGPCALVGPPDAAQRELLARLLADLRAQAAVADPARIEACCLGMNGIDFADEFAAQLQGVVEAIGLPPARIRLVNDGIIALASGTRMERALLLQHGTGITNAYCARIGAERSYDLLGVGRFADLRCDLLTLTQRMIDGRHPPTPLCARCLAFLGLNHLGFIHRITAAGGDATPAIMPRLAEEGGPFAASAHLRAWVAATATFPIAYLDYYLFPERQLAQQRAAPLPRSRQIMQCQRELFAQAADPRTVTKPEALRRRGGGGYAGVTFTALAGILGGTGERLVCSVRNQGAVAGIEDDAVVEVLCALGKDGPVPVRRQESLPLACRGLVQAVKACETLTVQAAMEGRRDLCYQAMLNHPLCGDLDIAVPLVDEMLDAHGLDYR